MDWNEQALRSDGKSKLTPTASASSPSTGPTLSGTETSEPLTGQPLSPSPSCAPASPVSLSAWPANALSKKMSDGCGRKLFDAFAYLDHDSFSWKTCQESLFGASMTFSQIWPRAGTMRNGIACQRSSLAWTKNDLAYSLWPTPMASDALRATLKVESLAKHVASQKAKGHGCCGIFEVAAVEFGERPSPHLMEWLMGFPQNWTVLEPLEIASSRRSRNGSGGKSCKRKERE